MEQICSKLKAIHTVVEESRSRGLDVELFARFPLKVQVTSRLFSKRNIPSSGRRAPGCVFAHGGGLVVSSGSSV